MSKKPRFLPQQAKKYKIFLSAGEASGDLLASSLYQEMKKIHPKIEAYGITGPSMKISGIKETLSSEIFNVMGFSDILKKISYFKSVESNLIKYLEKAEPDLAILVDNQEFHQNLAEQLKLRGIPTILYVAPQVWAWRKSRALFLQNKYDLILGMLPFETDFFKNYDVKYKFIGSSIYERCSPFFKNELTISNERIISFFPGSRLQELKNMIPIMLKVMTNLKSDNTKLILHIKKEFPFKDIKKKLGIYKFNEINNENKLSTETGVINYTSENSLSLMQKSSFCVVTSGTASLECALVGTPLLVLYKTSSINYHLAKKLIKIPYISLPNLILKKSLIKEFIQKFDPIEVSNFIRNSLENQENLKNNLKEFIELRNSFPKNSSKKGAQIIFDFLSKK